MIEQTSQLRQPVPREDSATASASDNKQARGAALNPGGVNAVVLGLWVAFSVTLLVDSGSIADLWQRFRDWPILAQMIVGMLLLPWVVATWVWQSGWTDWLRVAIVVLLALATIATFSPRRR